MTVLLTGGAGYIGSHTAVELLETGHEIVIVDNFTNSYSYVPERITAITSKAFSWYKADITDAKALDDIFSKHDIDCVIHFAGLKAVSESVENPLKYYRVNLNSTLTLLEVMEAHGVNKIIFSSSASVYGTPKNLPATEDMPAKCASSYAQTKWVNEQILFDVARSNPLMSVAILRYFNPIGAHPSGLIGEMPQKAPDNLLPYITGVASGEMEKLRIFGADYPTPDGTCIRDYIHVTDIALGHIAAMKYIDTHKGAEIFNLGSGRGYSVLEVVTAFEEATGISIPYTIDARRPGDTAEYYADTTKAEHLLGFKASKSLIDMCRDAWNMTRLQNAEDK